MNNFFYHEMEGEINMIDDYKFIKKSIQSVDSVYDLISDDYIKWALRIIKNEKLNVPFDVLEYLNNEIAK